MKKRIVTIEDTKNEQADSVPLKTTIEMLLKDINDLIFPGGKPYDPQVIKHNTNALKIHKEIAAVNTAMQKSIENIDRQIANLGKQSQTQENLASKLLKTMGFSSQEEPTEMMKLSETAIAYQAADALKMKEEIIKNAFAKIKQLKEELTQIEQEAYPEQLNADHFNSVSQHIAEEHARMIQYYEFMGQRIKNYGMKTDMLPRIGQVLYEIENITISAQEAKDEVQRTALNSQHYAAIIHAKNSIQHVTKQFTELSNILEYQMMLRELELMETLFSQIYVMNHQFEGNSLLQQLHELLRDERTNLFKLSSISKETPAPANIKIVNETYESMLEILKNHQNNFKSSVDIEYLRKRAHVFSALDQLENVRLYHQLKLLNDATYYNFDELLKNPDLALSHVSNLIRQENWMEKATSHRQQIDSKTAAFMRDFPELLIEEKVTDGKASIFFSDEDSSYPLIIEASEYNNARIKLLDAIESGDKKNADALSIQDYASIYKKLVTSQHVVKNYMRQVKHLNELKRQGGNLVTQIERALAQLPTSTLPEQDATNKQFEQKLRDLLLSAQKTTKNSSIQSLGETAKSLETTEHDFAKAQQEYTTQTKIIKLRSSFNQQISKAQGINTVFTNILIKIDNEKKRIRVKHGNHDQRLAILTNISKEINVEITRINQLIKSLQEVKNTVHDSASLERSSQRLQEFKVIIKSEDTRTKGTIGLILADKHIEQLTLAKQNRLMAFINKHIVRPIVSALHKKSQEPIRPSFFINVTEVELKMIRDTAMQKKSNNPVDENKENDTPTIE